MPSSCSFSALQAVALATLLIATTTTTTTTALPHSTDGPVVTVQAGQLRGVFINTTQAFLGVPYAAPPVRWMSPTPVQPWSGVRDATAFAHACMQGPGEGITYMSEDCLYLNVYAPGPSTPAPGAGFPVMFYIHGGAYINGESNEDRLNGTSLVEDIGDVVVVTINYRLNIFGFLGSDELMARSNGSTGNYGIQDQRFAMQWVQANIAAFRGNPSNITIFGESAGAGSVSVHVMSPFTEGLFQQAIMESGGFSTWVVQPYVSALHTYASVLTATSCSDVNCLLSLPASLLVDVSEMQTALCPTRLVFAPTIDGVEVLDDPWQQLRNGTASPRNIPIMIGFNHDEGSMFTPLPQNATELDFAAWVSKLILPAIGAVQTAELLKLYPIDSFPATPCCSSYFLASAQILTDMDFACPTLEAAAEIAAFQQKNNNNNVSSTYVYYFTHVPVGAPFCYHSSELPFVFHVESELQGGAQELQLSHAMATYWTNMAKYGSPNAPQQQNEKAKKKSGVDSRSAMMKYSNADLPEWPAFSADSALNIQLDYQIGIDAGTKSKQCALWYQIRPKLICPK